MELPLLEPIYQKYKDQGLRIVTVDVRGDDDGAIQFRDENDLSYTMLSGNIPVAQQYQIQYVPYSYIVGPDGTIEAAHGGVSPQNVDEFEAMLASHLE